MRERWRRRRMEERRGTSPFCREEKTKANYSFLSAPRGRSAPEPATSSCSSERGCVCVCWTFLVQRKKEAKEAASPKNDEKVSGGPVCSQTPPISPTLTFELCKLKSWRVAESSDFSVTLPRWPCLWPAVESR